MANLWGSSNKNNNTNDNGDTASSVRDSGDHERAPDEHTRLLPNRVESSHNYLSPDDPAVSPYNLWSVRIVRYLTVFLALVTFIWWVIQLVSVFVTLPGFHTRGSGFFAFSFASVALANLLFTLVFFAIPSKAVRVLSVIMGGVLLINAVLLLSVEKTRHEEGWVGMASVLCKYITKI
jgi:small-conductance mechanosensitive channel